MQTPLRNEEEFWINCCVLNCNSLFNKVNSVYVLLCSKGLSLLAISETWLLESIPSSFVDVPGFKFYRGDVHGSVRKHGAGLYVADTLSCVQVEVDLPNVVVCRVLEYNRYIISLYRPPSYTDMENDRLLNFLSDFCSGRDVLLLGDFNLPTLKWSEMEPASGYVSPLDASFYEFFCLSGLHQCVTQPTFYPSGNILDLVFSSDVDTIESVEVGAPLSGCHHCPVLFSYSLGRSVSRVPVEGEARRLWFRGNYSVMMEELDRIDWDGLFLGCGVEACYSSFLDKLQELIDIYVPLGIAPDNFWCCAPPRSLLRSKSRAWDNFKAVRREFGRNSLETEQAFSVFQAANREVRLYSLSRQRDYELNLLKRSRAIPKLFHSYIRRKKKGSPPIGPLKIGDEIVSENRNMCESFADYFGSVYDGSNPVFSFPDLPRGSQMDPVVLNFDVVFRKLSQLSASSAAGPDGVHPQVLKSCAGAVAYPLLLVFQKS